MANRPHPLEQELVAAILLQVLQHSDDPELVQEATNPKPNPDRLHALLVRHNESRHATLMGRQQQGAAPVSMNGITGALANAFRRPRG